MTDKEKRSVGDPADEKEKQRLEWVYLQVFLSERVRERSNGGEGVVKRGGGREKRGRDQAGLFNHCLGASAPSAESFSCS